MWTANAVCHIPADWATAAHGDTSWTWTKLTVKPVQIATARRSLVPLPLDQPDNDIGGVPSLAGPDGPVAYRWTYRCQTRWRKLQDYYWFSLDTASGVPAGRRVIEQRQTGGRFVSHGMDNDY